MDWASLVVPPLHELKAYQPGITEEKLRRDTGIQSIFKFASNEAPFAPSPSVEAAMRGALVQANRYPDPQALLNSLAEQLQVPVSCLRLGNGSIDIIESLVRVFVDEHHNVVLSRFGYSAYSAFVKAQRATIRLAESGPDFSHNVDNLLANVDSNTRMILIDSPSNLAGQWLDAEAIQCLLARLPRHVILVLDEAYVEFVDGDFAAESARLPLRHPQLVITRTFSKAYGLAGMRVGYGIADSGVIDYLNRICRPFPVSGVALAGAQAALVDQGHIERIVVSTTHGRSRLAGALSAINIPVCQGYGNFILADFGDAAQRVYEEALKRGFIMRSMNAYGLLGHLRISIGTSKELGRLIALIKELSGNRVS